MYHMFFLNKYFFPLLVNYRGKTVYSMKVLLNQYRRIAFNCASKSYIYVTTSKYHPSDHHYRFERNDEIYRYMMMLSAVASEI